ncbi:MAG: PilN domain-containing protein [Betaproteobacteria bacterium]|nr:PilN domain-containing protein [Betaproteobacteria bacterium]
MNVRINLLPHREERRQRGRQHFAVLAGLTAILGAVVVGAGYLYIAGMISTQDQRNAFLRSEIAKLDKEIAEIKKLKDEIAALLARKQIIETLQADRAQTVHLLDQLVRQMPEGVYLRQLRQRGLSINVQGYAQSNARVSTLMRNIESSPWLASPQLIEIKASRVGSKRLSEFNMNLQLKRVQLKEAPKDAAKAPAKKG